MNNRPLLPTFTIATPDGRTQASFVPERGGVVSSFIVEGTRELLFQHDCFWDKDSVDLPGGMPFCFPICGRLTHDGIEGQYEYEGNVYSMPIHGLAWWMPWQVIAHESDRICLALHDNAKTREIYPFKFNVELDYLVKDNVLICTHTYRNKGTESMPYSAGFHPYFLTPPPNNGKEQVRVEFEALARYVYNEYLTDTVGKTTPLDLPESICAPHLNEQLSLISPEQPITLHYPDNHRLIMQEDSGVLLSHLQLYTDPKLPFFCIEPWMAPPNAMNSGNHLRILKPQQVESGVLQLAWF